MKVLWQGTDALYLVRFPKHSKKIKYVYMFCLRIVARILDFFAAEHYCDHKLQKYRLIQFGMKKKITVMHDPVWHPKKYPKKKHKGFNILYYCPMRLANGPLWKWVYGYDIYQQLKAELTDVNWIFVDGTADMSKLFPIVDFYLRPTRDDGSSRLRQECEINNIPYYWSQQEPDINEIRKDIVCARSKRG